MSGDKNGYNKDSLSNTFIVALGVCLVCATLVSSAAVFLKPLQESNKLTDRKKNILAAAGLLEETSDINALFGNRIKDIVIDLETGKNVSDQYEESEQYPEGVASYDQIDVAESNNKEKSVELKDDPATIKRKELHSHVYIVKSSDTDDTPAMYVFPIRGKGLWSIMKGFIALDSDLRTIKGITFYEHGETPGLGGEIDNPEWKSHWVGKELYGDQGDVAIKIVKGEWESDPHAIDSLSGATITSRGVEKMLDFWMGDRGFGEYIERIRSERNNASSGDAAGEN